MLAVNYARLGRRNGTVPPMPEGIALLHQDYLAWRRRVVAGEQPDTEGTW
jgi:hypothetical protein